MRVSTLTYSDIYAVSIADRPNYAHDIVMIFSQPRLANLGLNELGLDYSLPYSSVELSRNADKEPLAPASVQPLLERLHDILQATDVSYM